jgi:hypothetical protein
MKAKICEACHMIGKSNAGKCSDEIYLSGGGRTTLRLCYTHSVELFKIGQTNFLSKYRPYIEETTLGKVEENDPFAEDFNFNPFN